MKYKVLLDGLHQGEIEPGFENQTIIECNMIKCGYLVKCDNCVFQYNSISRDRLKIEEEME